MIGSAGYGGPLGESAALAESLVAAGLEPGAAAAKAALFGRAAGALEASAGRQVGSESQPTGAFFVPGRIEILGKHTDYAGGRTLVAAAQRGFCIAVRARGDATVVVRDVIRGETASFPFRGDIEPQAGRWTNYPMSVARRLARNFPGTLRGAEIALASDLPSSAGMSSSSALVVGMFLALDAVNSFSDRPEFHASITNLPSLAGYLATHENGQDFGTLAGDAGVGTFGGSEDHTAILCCQSGMASEFSYCPVVFRRSIPIPAGSTFAVASSGVVAAKTGSAMARYNAISRKVTALMDLWHQAGGAEPTLAAVVAGGPATVERLREVVAACHGGPFTSQELDERLKHFLAENESVLPKACDALARRDLTEFGRQTENSQKAAEQLLGNQVPETAALATLARREGAHAASSFGAGFGGSVWALVDTDAADAFLARWESAYRAEFPRPASRSSFFLTPAGPAAFSVR